MKFIHAVVYTQDEMKYGDYDTGSWDNLNNGDYIVHCLYSVDNEQVIILEDNCHAPVENMIESFLDGVIFANSTNVGGIMIPNEEVEIAKALVVVDNGLSYNKKAVGLRLVEGNYTEVEN